MKKLLLLAAAAAALTAPVCAQRVMDKLDRGLVAMKTDAGVFCTWRINADEWASTQYNIYRAGTKLNETPLNVSNFTDPNGSLDATYTVKAVVNGVEIGEASNPASVWENNYTVITPNHPAEITVKPTPNDATVADVDGDGELEIIMKYDPAGPSYSKGDNGIFTVIECLEMDGTVKWWMNMGPNMGDFQNNEINIAAYDWDLDGKAEVVFRAADGTTIHKADGTTYVVGDASINYRGTDDEFPSGQWFLRWGKEYLIYANGETGEVYQNMEYPLKRVEDANNPKGILSGGEYDGLISSEWGDRYGHRSSKYFFAAPYLDGRKPSLFLGRGIYTKHKFITYDIDPATHSLIERWRWTSDGLDSEWYGQGYHNMGVADVDWDGRDEIVYGSMVIDDNGYGLSTTGLGHGDAQHCGDFDPYTHGQEIFACNEDRPGNNYRDATTSKIYYRYVAGDDDGRAMMGNFVDEYPGAEGISSRDPNLVGGASHKAIVGDNKGTVSVTQNFRVFWDGDLCDETFDYSNGKNSAGAIYNGRGGRIAVLEGSKTNNDSKGTPCFQGDILGDWREEYIMRDGSNNIRIYSTDIPTEHRIYSLWYDHQYRNAMVWQMCGYNQPPHVSFALSVFEDITVPPTPATMTNRTEVANGATIDASLSGKEAIICETNDMTVTASAAATPASLTVNTPTWVQGHNNNNNITTKTYTHTISGGTFAGEMSLTKQGDGKLIMPAGTHTYSGKTDVWGGTVALDGELSNSPVWLNRFAVLETSALAVPKGLDMNYASVLRLGSDDKAGSLNTGDMTLGFGAIVEIDMFANGTADTFNASKLIIEKKDWTNGPEYLQPILKLAEHPEAGQDMIPDGKYLLGEFAAIDGSIADLILLGMDEMKKELVYEDGKLYLNVSAFPSAPKTWVGDGDGIWNLAHSANFKNLETSEQDMFVPGDEVTFDDSAAVTDVVIEGRLKPASVTFNNTDKDYTLSGEGQIIGATKLVKEGTGTLTINNANSYTGGTYINNGKVVVSTLANTIGTDYGALSDINSRIYINNGSTLAVTGTTTMGQRITAQKGNAVLEVPKNATLTSSKGVTAASIGQSLIKRGQGTLNLGTNNTISKLVIEEGTVNAAEDENSSVISLPKTVEFVNGVLHDPANIYSYSSNPTNYVVAEGNKGTLYLDARCTYTGKLTGAGKFTVYATSVRADLKGDWSGFEGELTINKSQVGSYGPDFKWDNNYGMPKATLNIPSGMTFRIQNYNMKLANLKGNGIFNTGDGNGNKGSLTIGNDDTDISFTGKFTGKPDIIKIGACDWNMTKAVDTIASITAQKGFISLNASKNPETTTILTAPLSIQGSSVLRGRGIVGNITVSGNGTIEPGIYGNASGYHYGKITSTGDVYFNNGTTLSLYIRKAGNGNPCSTLEVKGKLTLNCKVFIDVYSGYEPKEGDEFTLWTAGSISGNPEIEIAPLPDGFEWDTSALSTANGVVRVAKSSGVTTITDNYAPVSCTVYNAMGVVLGKIDTTKAEAVEAVKRELNLNSGIYIIRLEAEGAAETIKIQL